MHSIAAAMPGVLSELIFVTGGQQRSEGGLLGSDGWSTCRDGRIAVLDTSTGHAEVVLRHETDVSLLPTEGFASLTFKSASVCGATILATTEREVVSINAATWDVERITTNRLFNDVHHAVDDGGELLVAASGMDAVIRCTYQGEVREVYPTSEKDRPLGEPRQQVDFRLISTKPHSVHPNFLFSRAGEWWVTRCNYRDATSLSSLSQTLPVGLERVHDGVPVGDSVWFTTVDGCVVEVDGHAGRPKTVIDVQQVVGASRPLGWCRGLFLRGDIALVGFSQLRQTKLRANVRWLANRGQGPHQPGETTIVALDLARQKPLAIFPLTPIGMDTVSLLMRFRMAALAREDLLT